MTNFERSKASSSNEKLKTLLSNLEKQTDSDFYISECEVPKAINHLSKDKTRDPFNLKAEHFIFAVSDNFVPKNTGLINGIFHSKEFPSVLSTSMILPLVKSFKKSLKDPNNYRGISIIPILTKIIELIIIDKMPLAERTQHPSIRFCFRIVLHPRRSAHQSYHQILQSEQLCFCLQFGCRKSVRFVQLVCFISKIG